MYDDQPSDDENETDGREDIGQEHWSDRNLPRLHTSETEDGPVDRLERTLRADDGPLSPSNAFVKPEAEDVGDELRANPRGEDLGYYADANADVSTSTHNEFDVVMFDRDLGATYNIWVDEDTLVEDVRNFN
jgi:hypothetical protein